LYSNRTGSYNVAVGSRALESSFDTNSNTAIGNDALRLNRGGNNTAVGALALQNNDQGFYNTALGSEALASNTGGSNNIAVGYQAGNLFTTGHYNIAIGHVGVAHETATTRIGTTGTWRVRMCSRRTEAAVGSVAVARRHNLVERRLLESL
jgi:hypothetical protein